AGVATEAGTILGTVGYMSPEQVSGETADARSDIFSFGAVLYEMLSRRRAFPGRSAGETMAAIRPAQPPELSPPGIELPIGLDRIVSRCLEKAPNERFQTARDLAFALQEISSASAAAPPIAATSRPSVRPARLHRFFPWMAVFALILVAGAALLLRP